MDATLYRLIESKLVHGESITVELAAPSGMRHGVLTGISLDGDVAVLSMRNILQDPCDEKHPITISKLETSIFTKKSDAWMLRARSV